MIVLCLQFKGNYIKLGLQCVLTKRNEFYQSGCMLYGFNVGFLTGKKIQYLFQTNDESKRTITSSLKCSNQTIKRFFRKKNTIMAARVRET